MDVFVILAVVIPVLGSGATLVLPYKRWTALFCSGVSFGVLCRLIIEPLPLEFIIRLPMNPVHIGIFIDGFSLIFALLLSFLFFLAVVYSSYIEARRYYSLLLLDLGLLLLIVFSQELLIFYVFLEMSTIVTYFLVIYNETEEAVKAGFKYLIMNVGGAILILLAILLKGSSLGALLFVAGCLVKAGSFPVHVWLADAHPAAPSAVSALLSGALVKVGVYSLFRFAPHFGADLSWLVYVALTSMVIGVFLALVQSDVKRILAYSTVSQLGIVLLGMVLQSDVSVSGGMLHFVNHGLFKALLFLCMGCVIYATGERDIHHLGGLHSKMPVTAAACLVGCLSISGIPPFNGFVSKSILFHALESNVMKVAFVVTSAGTVASFTRLFRHAFLGTSGTKVKRVPRSMRLPLVVLSGLCILLGFFPGIVLSLTGYTVEYDVWSSSAVPEVLLTAGLGIAFYFVGLKTKVILETPSFSIVDRFFCGCGKSIEYFSELLNRWLTQDVNYYAAYMILFLVFLFFLLSF